ncbi:hypothetical protein D9758_013238 [Tetrapyrgos nigripes]|uniref:DUF6699 domain-containing protein n=1 Tax=Tetrapyrgos nigripes TaxID=182062 RepID=A0A8H5CM60_9AGAR|nr:hypothetical protein D9758_013238 [Tetrapyrgos nigripes]
MKAASTVPNRVQDHCQSAKETGGTGQYQYNQRYTRITDIIVSDGTSRSLNVSRSSNNTPDVLFAAVYDVLVVVAITPRFLYLTLPHLQLPHCPNPHKLYSSIPLPAQVDPGVSVIPFLRSGSVSGLDIDLTMSSRQLGLRGGRAELQRYLGAPATSPPLPSMTVVHPKLPWAITVHFSEMGYVTVWDVLVTIVETLRIPIYPDIVHDGNGTPRRQGEGGGKVRLDYLPGKRLVGLRKSQLGEDVWLMDIL